MRSSEHRFRKLFEADLIGVFVTKLDGTFLDCNDAMVQILGYDSREELMQHRSSELYVDPEFRREAIRMLQKDGIYLGQEGRVWRKDGSIAHLLGAAVLLQDEDTEEPYVQGVAVDITERKHAEEALQASEQRYRKLFEANLAGVYLTKPDGTILDFNTAMMRMLGYDSREEMFQHRSTDFYADPEFRKELIYLLQKDGIVPAREATLLRKDGSVLHAIGHAVLLANEQTGEPYIQGAAIDITERKQAEELLRELTRTLESKVAQRTAELQRRTRQLQKIMLELLETEDRERRRLGEILHDDLQQELAAAKFHVRLMKSQADSRCFLAGDRRHGRAHAQRRDQQIPQPVARAQPGRDAPRRFRRDAPVARERDAGQAWPARPRTGRRRGAHGIRGDQIPAVPGGARAAVQRGQARPGQGSPHPCPAARPMHLPVGFRLRPRLRSARA